MDRLRLTPLQLGLSGLTAGLFLLSLAVGTERIPLATALRQALTGDPGVYGIILAEIRLPRSLIALFTGATLGLCGAVMQGLLRNPLASPGLVGSSSGAAFGAVVALYFGLSAQFPLAQPLGGMLGAFGATLLVWLLAGRDQGVLTLILAGIAVNSFALALISLLLNLAPSPYAVQEIAFWMLGSLHNRSMTELWLLLPGTLIGWALLRGAGPALDALTLGEETASSLGFDLDRLRLRLFAAIALAVGSAIAITGTIGFIGLVTPHLLRPLVGHQPGRLLVVSALGGASMLLAADILVRLLPTASKLHVGVVTALIGAPFFLWLILRTRSEQP